MAWQQSDPSTGTELTVGGRWAISGSGVLFAVLLAMLLVAVPGCNGCGGGQGGNANQQKPEDKEKEEKEKQKPNFEFARLFVQPSDSVLSRNAVKPGHYVTTTQQMKANNFDFLADLQTAAVDRNRQPLPVTHTRFSMVMSRPAGLPKGQAKRFEATYFVPRAASGNRAVWLQSSLRSRRGGRSVDGAMQPTTSMPEYQYYFVVLSADPDAYGFVKGLDLIMPPADDLAQKPVLFYRVVLPRLQNRVPMPSNGLAWTMVAYVLWDGVNPASMTPDQQQAMIDWLHWGGQLIISGPDSLDLLRGSFLEPYLPATAVKSIDLHADAFQEINDYWSLYNKRTKEDLKLEIQDGRPLLGIEMAKAPNAEYLRDTGQLVIERPVGRGRTVVSAFPLSAADVVNWKSYDGFFNTCLMRRPRREFIKPNRPDNLDIPQMKWADHSGAVTKPEYATALRYFSRDMGHYVDEKPDDRPVPNAGTPQTTSSTTQDATATNATVAAAVAVSQPVAPGGESAPASKDDVPESVRKADHWRFGGFHAWAGAGMGGWNDFSGTADASRDALRDAAGISIPKASFVFRVLAVYLAVLVPLNWLVFRVIGRVEWAWVAAPLIAIVGAVVVVRLAQLDIGFARSRTEIATLEVQGNYTRGHLTRFTALYTSLSTSYSIKFDDPTSLAQPFPVRQGERVSSVYPVHFRRDADLRLTGYHVESNKTGMVRSEQMFELGGTFRLEGDEASGYQIHNDTRLKLQDAAVVRRNAANKPEVAWLGELSSGTGQELQFAASTEPRPKEWDDSLMTKSYESEVEGILAQHDTDKNFALSVKEWQAFGQTEPDHKEYDRDRSGGVDRRELVSWCRRTRAGEISLGRLFDLASLQLQLGPGEMRLIAWTEQEMPGVDIRPKASQAMVRMLVVAHLKRPKFVEVARDRNTRFDIADDAPDETQPFEVMPTQPTLPGLPPAAVQPPRPGRPRPPTSPPPVRPGQPPAKQPAAAKTPAAAATQ